MATPSRCWRNSAHVVPDHPRHGRPAQSTGAAVTIGIRRPANPLPAIPARSRQTPPSHSGAYLLAAGRVPGGLLCIGVTMSNFLARCAAIGLVGGGFAATGDLGWLAARGMRLVNARTIPSEESPADAAAPVSAADPAVPLPTPMMPPTAADPFRGPAAARPVVQPVADRSPPTAGPDSLDLATLRPGERVTVWIGQPTNARQPWIAFDVVDPTAGEALLFTPGIPPRRVRIRAARGSQPSVVAKGAGIVIVPLGPAHHGQAGGEPLGPVTALAIGR